MTGSCRAWAPCCMLAELVVHALGFGNPSAARTAASASIATCAQTASSSEERRCEPCSGRPSPRHPCRPPHRLSLGRRPCQTPGPPRRAPCASPSTLPLRRDPGERPTLWQPLRRARASLPLGAGRRPAAASNLRPRCGLRGLRLLGLCHCGAVLADQAPPGRPRRASFCPRPARAAAAVAAMPPPIWPPLPQAPDALWPAPDHRWLASQAFNS
mmetsp:Transcript_58003/g.168255  ORF Transcript_58003/g.168255 Transcript_58003/m.168255 type:complete len:214 (+) Transcript_58003:894-1535(+)